MERQQELILVERKQRIYASAPLTDGAAARADHRGRVASIAAHAAYALGEPDMSTNSPGPTGPSDPRPNETPRPPAAPPEIPADEPVNVPSPTPDVIDPGTQEPVRSPTPSDPTVPRATQF